MLTSLQYPLFVKRKWLLPLLLLVLFSMPLPASAAAQSTQTTIILNDQTLTGAKDVMTVNGSTMVPVRVISENLGYQVIWNKSNQQVTVSNGASRLAMTIGINTADSSNGKVTLDQPSFIQSGVTYVPLRFVSEQMGLDVQWDNASKTVSLQSNMSSMPGMNDDGDTTDDGAATATPQVDAVSFSDNRLLISANAVIKLQSSVLTNPNRIVIDLPGATFSDKFLQGKVLEQGDVQTLAVPNSTVVKQIRYSIYSTTPAQVRLVIDLHQSQSFTTYAQGNLIFVDLNTSSNTKPIGTNGKKVVVIDPGHGDTDSGGVGITGVLEKDVVLKVGNKVAALLKKESQIDLIMTRTDDTFIPLDNRVKIAEQANADVFLSIHGNAAPNINASGTETFYADTARSKKLSDIIQKHVLEATGFKDRGSKQANYVVIRKTTMPAALLEIGFLTNKTEESIIVQDDFQNKVAQAIVDGLKEYLGIS
ncbi:N-acetylmuramoyl-L-alanine amidase [Paenibacillus sp. WLX2291]|uniref:N-acetylmuramoyl-L-alanine amidase n=1 Tax=Paenibacillus sp. WLX2291 TaxID=3296934 RepID=UPI0039843CB1